MKTLVVVFFSFIAVQLLSAQPTGFTVEKKSAIVDNLTQAIVSDNTGLQTSGVLVLSNLINGSYLKGSDASKALIPLLKLLKEGKNEEDRIAAAVAIYDLGNEVGIYSLRETARFDSNKRVSDVCKNLYYSYHKLNGTQYLISF